MATAARVLWTKQVRKKAKTYNDGFLLISASGKATLFNEDGETLSTSSNKLPYGLVADPAGAEDITCFEGYLVQGDSACEPSDISAARGCPGLSSDDSNLSSSTAHASTAGPLARRPGPRNPAGGLQRGCAGMGGGGAVAPAGPPRAPALGSRKSIRPHAGAAGTPTARGTAAGAASAASAAAHVGNRAGGPGAPLEGCRPQQHQQQGLRPGQGFAATSTGGAGSGGVSTGWGAGAAAVQDAGQAAAFNNTSGPSLHSDTDILNLLDMITPTSCDPPDSSGGPAFARQQQQQQQQYQPRPLPAVPQFGRQHKPSHHHQQQQHQQQPERGMSAAWQPEARPLPSCQEVQQQEQHQEQQQQGASASEEWCGGPGPNAAWPTAVQQKQQQSTHKLTAQQQPACMHAQAARQQWQQPKEQQQQWDQCQQQQGAAHEHTQVPPEASTTAAQATRSAAFWSARNALGAPQRGTNGAARSSASMPGRQVLHPVQSEAQQQQQQQQAQATWQHPQAQQPQQQQQQQQKARAVWGQPQTQQRQQQEQLEPVQQQWGVAPAAAAAAAAVPRAVQQRAGFKMPTPAQPPSAGTTGDPTGGRPPHKAPAIAGQQQQQRGPGQGYCYPGPSATGLQRFVQVPTGFGSAHQYVAVLTAALTEEVNLQLAEQARTFYNIVRQVQAAQPGPAGTQRQNHHHQQQQQQQRGSYQQQQQRQPQGGRQQGAGPDLASRLQAACSRAGLHYHPGASLTVYNNSSSNSRGGSSRGGGAWGKGKKRGRGYNRGEGHDEEGEEEEGAPARKAVSMYLTLPGKLDRRHFRKHDLWVLSNNPLLNASAANSGSNSGPYDRLSQPWTVLARACWHGPDRDGKMEVELLPGQQQQLPPHHKWQRQQSLTALQGPDVATDVQVADFVGSADIRGWALLGCLLKPWQQQQQAGTGASLLGPAAAAAAAAAANEASGSSGIDSLSDPTESPGHGDGSAGGVGNSSQEDVVPGRRRKRRSRHADSSGSSSDEDDKSGQPGRLAGAMHHLAAAEAAATAGSDSDLEADFEPAAASRPGKRLRRAAAAAAAAEGADSLDDCLDNDPGAAEGSSEPDAAVAGRSKQGAQAAGDGATDAVPSTSAAAATRQELLRHVVQRFRLNPAQAAVAAHVADWLPQLMRDVQQRQQQGKMRGTVKPKATALTANRAPSAAAAAAAAAAAGAGGTGSAGGTSGSRAPVCLIHGPFGSGKSTLLVALIHLLTGLGEQQAEKAQGSGKAKQQRPTPRILVAAHTNVAVDRVLLGLQEAGFSNMLRVGSLARIAKQLLGVSLHSADDSRDALSQLNGMLRDAAGAEEAMIRSEIAAIQAGAERRRRKTLSTTAVVGITCCSALQSTLEGQVFDVVLLDEASQMTEPTSLVPLLRAKPRFLIAAGDPCQLPPVLATPTAVTPTATAAPGRVAEQQQQQQQQHQQQQGAVAYGLLRPLFVRLTQMGHIPHLLTHQYRCHPMLSLLSNKHFYNSRLVDGVTAAQRGPLVPGLPPLVMCDCQGGSSQAAGAGSRSSINKAEANLVAQLVVRLLTKTSTTEAAAEGVAGCNQQGNGQHEESMNREALSGGGGGSGGSQAAPVLLPHQLGVIGFFRGQAALIKQLITADPSCPNAADVQVATVDSFQGAEKEVIILATTTTNPHSEFCSDGARLNVALTRARRHLLVVGAASVLKQTPSSVFRELLSICSSGYQGSAAFMHGGSLLQLLGRQQ